MTSNPRIKRVVIAAAVAVAIGVAVYLQAPGDVSGAVLGAVGAFAAMVLGLTATAAVRPLPTRSVNDHVRLLGFSLGVGVALGAMNLTINYGIAQLDPAIYAEMTGQWSKFSFWSVAVTGPLAEEIAFRLVLMGCTGWIVSRFTRNAGVVFGVALAVSSTVFGLVHILPGSRPTAGALHATLVALKSGVLGVPLGWMFWKKGLPYSAVSHGTGNAFHFFVGPMVF